MKISHQFGRSQTLHSLRAGLQQPATNSGQLDIKTEAFYYFEMDLWNISLIHGASF